MTNEQAQKAIKDIIDFLTSADRKNKKATFLDEQGDHVLFEVVNLENEILQILVNAQQY